MNTRIIRNISTLAAIGLLASSCIQVGNVEKAWGDAKVDPELLGSWKGNDNAKCVFIKTEKDYFLTSGTNGLEGCCKSFESNGHKFVIVASLQTSVLGFDQADDDSKKGTLLRYSIKGDTMTFYSLDDQVITKAIKAKEVPGEVDENDAGGLTVLDDATIQWLGKMADGKGWTENVYKRDK